MKFNTLATALMLGVTTSILIKMPVQGSDSLWLLCDNRESLGYEEQAVALNLLEHRAINSPGRRSTSLVLLLGAHVFSGEFALTETTNQEQDYTTLGNIMLPSTKSNKFTGSVTVNYRKNVVSVKGSFTDFFDEINTA